MTTSRILAALLGPMFLVTGLMILTNLGAMPAFMVELAAVPVIIVLAGYVTFLPGLAIVLFHNRWQWGWPLLVTLSGWLLLVAGAIRILFAARLAAVLDDIAPSVLPALPAIAVVMLAIGGYLSFQGCRRG